MSSPAVDSLWVVISACFVFFMQAGFICFEVGFVRPKNVVSVAIENIVTFVVTTLVFCFFGFGLMYGPSWHGVVGSGFWLLGHLAEAPNPLHYSFTFFQLMFTAASVTIFSGSMSERTRLSALVIADLAVAGLIYPLFAHWVWGGAYTGQVAWLQRLGFFDFAGATVVHSTAGWLALAGIIVVGARTGRFDQQGRVRRLGHSNIPFAALGTFVLWLSWFGFNGGSLFRLDESVGLVLLNTNFAAAAGAMGALLATRVFLRNRSYMEALFAGSLGGLVAITAASNWLRPLGAITIGLIAGVVVVLGNRLLEFWRLDDAVGAVPIHAFGGSTGALLAPLFVSPALLPAGSRLGQLAAQLVGVGVNFAWAFGLGLVLFTLLRRFAALRVSREEERRGLNIVEFADIYSWTAFLKTRRYRSRNRMLNAQVRAQNTMLKRQAELLQATEQQERLRLGRDLHDGLGQSLAAAKLRLGLLRDRLGRDPTLQLDVARTLELVDGAIDEMHNTIHNLRPAALQTEGLRGSLDRLLQSVARSSGLMIERELPDLPSLGEMTELNLYRIVQEALTNVIKHAEASGVQVSLHRRGQAMTLTIVDDGLGFRPEEVESGVGLGSIRERVSLLGGRVSVESTPGRGTRLVVEVPLAEDSTVHC